MPASLMLTTQKYGRFVPVSGGEGEDQDDTDADELITPGLTNGGPTYFGDVSSVSGASGSEASVHFMEEEGEFARDFSEMPSHSSPATSKESPGGAEAESESKDVNSTAFETPTRSRNQEEADQDEEQPREQAEESSPVRKKHATSAASAAPTIAPKQKTKKETRPQPSTLDPLYPLLPETTRRERVVKAQTEFQRYKLQLKSHLQQLRHVGECSCWVHCHFTHKRLFCVCSANSVSENISNARIVSENTLQRSKGCVHHYFFLSNQVFITRLLWLLNEMQIRTQRFSQDLRLHRLSLGLATQRAEEQQLRDAMKHLLHLEREKLRDEHRSTTQTLRQLQRDHAERERALENYYATQLELVREQTQRELTERQIVEKAHRQASAQMLKELRQDRERQLVATLEQRRHLEEVRRVRRATWLDQALEQQQTTTRQHQDAFYVAAMKARDLRQRDSTATKPHSVAAHSRRRR
ncbi:hypothetical protein PINS_up011229 [Pythium insidiosum]|nr:hypothetical protein PINS_up011229 [Pythium insidiosum]